MTSSHPSDATYVAQLLSRGVENLAEVRAWAVENRARWARFVGAPEESRARGGRARSAHKGPD